MSLLKDINILFNNIHRYEVSLQEAKLSKDILKYSDKLASKVVNSANVYDNTINQN